MQTRSSSSLLELKALIQQVMCIELLLHAIASIIELARNRVGQDTKIVDINHSTAGMISIMMIS